MPRLALRRDPARPVSAIHAKPVWFEAIRTGATDRWTNCVEAKGVPFLVKFSFGYLVVELGPLGRFGDAGLP